MPENSQSGLPETSREKQSWEKMTRDTVAKRWIKKYKGKRFQSTSVGLTREGHKLAWEQFEKWRAGIDQQPAVNPFADDYARAIQSRKHVAEACMKWVERFSSDPDWRTRGMDHDFNLEEIYAFLRDTEPEGPLSAPDAAEPPTIEVTFLSASDGQAAQHYQKLYRQMIDEIAQIEKWAQKRRPKELDRDNSLPVVPLLTMTGDFAIDTWNRRLIDEFSIRQRLTKPVDTERTIAHQVERYLNMQLARAKAGEITPARFGVIRMHVTAFGRNAGEVEVKEFAEGHLSGFHGVLLAAVETGGLSRRTAADRLSETKSFLTWLDSERILPHLPRNLSRLRIKVPPTTPPALTDQQIESILNLATGRTRLYVLMMLNCGMTQVDLSDVTHSQLDLLKGTVTRKRSKTEEIESVPTVTHVLWDETLTLLKDHASPPDSKRAILTQDGLPLVKKRFRDGSSQVSNNDAIRMAFRRIRSKVDFPLTPKLFRKSSARKLKEHEIYSRQDFEDHFLGHAAHGIGPSVYSGGLSQANFNKAVRWLGKQWGFTTSRR